MTPTARRPLKSRDTAWARWLTDRLVARRIAPNQISFASLGFAGLGAVAMLAALPAPPGARAALFVLAAAAVQLRLLCNLLDGLVAVEGGLGDAGGPLWNELPDRLADPLLLVPAGYVCGLAWGPELAWGAAVLALLTANIRTLGGSLGFAQRFTGPMAKPHRMAALTAGLLLAAALTPWALDGAVLFATLALIVVGTAWTAWHRTRALMAELTSQ